MVFAAGRLIRDAQMHNPTIVLVADRVQLVRQMWDQFRTTDMPRLHVPETAADLHLLLTREASGMIFSTVIIFSEDSLLNTPQPLVIMYTEVMRRLEGNLS